MIIVGVYYMQVKFTFFTLHNNPDADDVVDIPDNSTDAEIQAYYAVWLADHASLTWEKLDD